MKPFFNNKRQIGISIIAALAVIGSIFTFSYMTFAHKDIEEQRKTFIETKNSIIGELIMDGKYACCLSKPCMYCIEKTPGHGEGATCNCLEDVVTGKHPCGECIGEIMEGHGNPFLAKFFARAIAEEVGEEYHEALKEMIKDKYDISVEEQM